MMMFKSGLGLALCGALVMNSEAAGGGAAAGGALQGAWGGDRMQMTMSAAGARFELECASGSLPGPITPGADGRFQARGTFEQHQPGAQRADQAPAAANARFSGEVQGGVLTLTVLPDGATQPQVFQLREGARVKLIRCL